MQGLMNTYQPLPVKFSHGKGALLWDTQGKEYLDAMAGIAVCALGHAHPEITAIISDQAGKLLHTSNLFEIPHQIALAEKLTRVSGMDSIFCANSGAEANEAAFKLARLYGHEKGIESPRIIVMEKSFHGRTLATLSASGSRKAQAGFEPLVQGFVRAPYNDLRALEAILQNDHQVVAVMLEPILGEGGIHLPHPDYLPQVKSLCEQYGCLMMLDEVQTGVGRTGKFYAYQHYDFLPDVVTTAKALGNGLPIGVCLTQGHASTLFHPGNHGSTFGGNPFVTRVASAVIDIIERDGLAARAHELGKRILSGLKKSLEGHPHVLDIRGQGLIMGVELDKPCRDFLHVALKNGLLVTVTAEQVIRILPPYIISDEQADLIVSRLVSSINAYYKEVRTHDKATT